MWNFKVVELDNKVVMPKFCQELFYHPPVGILCFDFEDQGEKYIAWVRGDDVVVESGREGIINCGLSIDEFQKRLTANMPGYMFRFEARQCGMSWTAFVATVTRVP